MEAIRNEENMQQLKKVQKLIIGMGEGSLQIQNQGAAAVPTRLDGTII